MESVAKIIPEGVDMEWLNASQRDAQVGSLSEPWIAEEGPVSARLSQRPLSEGALLPRGLAFDSKITVHWDEDGVQVVKAAPKDDGTVAIRQEVQVRQPEHLDGWGLPEGIRRIDYLQQGVCVASRYEIEPSKGGEGGPHA